MTIHCLFPPTLHDTGPSLEIRMEGIISVIIWNKRVMRMNFRLFGPGE
jgi:hypothetical protein